jgi:transcriptional regulator with XRE-family HTH domain
LKGYLEKNTFMPIPISPATSEVLSILAAAIRSGRIRRGMTVRELAERVGVSAPTVIKVERGDPGVAIGTVLEAAKLVGVPLFDEHPDVRGRYHAQKVAELAFLPAAARPRNKVDDDF